MGSLREFGREFWSEMVARCNATILSEVSNDQCDAYLLSESSLFVWDHSFLMITCGSTMLVNSVQHFLGRVRSDDIESIIYQRKNEYGPWLQKTSFAQDVERLQTMVDGVTTRFGYLDEHHTYMFHLDKDFSPRPNDTTTELLMYHIQGKAAQALRCTNQTVQSIREFMNLHEFFDGFQVDDYCFKPCGYSLNAIKDDRYVTIHMTPQEESSYVSFETNVNLEKDFPGLVDKLLETFEPFSFDVVDFNTQTTIAPKGKMVQINKFQDRLSCGYDVNFSHFIVPLDRVEKPTIVKGNVL
ncbi:MAG: adenosylmethionine decarboxylase [Halobacteriovorax sp.]|nr:adenosylmethionine decarboxylase [Halobacteriovorax sp.]